MRWTEKEKKLLTDNWSKSRDEILALFPERRWGGLEKKAKVLKLKKDLYWTEGEIIILKNNFPKQPFPVLSKLLPKRSKKSMIAKAFILNLKKEVREGGWTEKEIVFLKENYEFGEKEYLLKKLETRTWVSIVLMANKLKVSRSFTFCRKSDLSILLEDTSESYYWAGFIAADGHVSHVKNRLVLELAKKDKNHLLKFKNFIKSDSLNVAKGNCRVSAQDIDLLPKFYKKFDLAQRKTYNPPNVSILQNMEDDLFLSFLIGFIDGDGCIRYQTGRKDTALVIKIHKSWEGFLQEMSDRLYAIADIPIYNASTKNSSLVATKKYSTVTFSNSEILNFLKRKTISLDLPVLSRKWGKIDLNHVSRYRKGLENKIKVLELYNNGMCYKDIQKEVALSYAGVYKIIRNNI